MQNLMQPLLLKKMMFERLLVVSLAVMLIITACDQQEPEVVEQPTATLLPIITRTLRATATLEPTRTPLPTFTYTPTETPVPPTPTLSPTPTLTPTVVGIVQSLQRVNVRENAGVEFSAIDSVAPGTGVLILASNPEGTWYKVRLDDGTEGWMASRLLFLPPTTTPFPTTTPSPDLTRLFLGTPLPTTFFGGGTVTPTPPRAVRTTTPASVSQAGEGIEEPIPPTQSFLPIVNVNAINMTATALVGGAATLTPTPLPNTGREIVLTPVEGLPGDATPPAPPANVSLTPDQSNDEVPVDEARAQTGVDVFAFCNNRAYGIRAPENLAAGSTIDIFWAWFARTEDQVRQHIDASAIELRVNGQVVEELNLHRTNIFVENGDYVTYWYVPFGPLPAGDYNITYRVSWSRQITDGYNYYGPGTSIPFEEENCSFTVR